MEIEGIYGTYFKGSDGVKLEDKIYKDITEVEEEKKTVETRIEAKKEDMRKQIEKLSLELGDLMLSIPKQLNKYEEIIQVFSM